MIRSTATILWTGAFLFLGCASDPARDPEDPGDPNEPNPPPASLLVSVATTGRTLDPNGYAVEVDGVEVGHLGLTGGMEIAEIGAGEHAVDLRGVAANCSVTPPLPRMVLVAPAEQTMASFAVRCDSAFRNVILFTRIRGDGTFHIYWISPESSSPVHLMEGGFPSISPDGRKIAFGLWGSAIWTANVDGTNPVQLSPPGSVSQQPRWSPDGQRIAFASDRDGNYEIYTMQANGSDQRRLTINDSQDLTPVWSPDGSRLAYTHTIMPENNVEIFLINADGTGEVNLTNHPDADNILDWSPDDRLLINTTRDQLSNEIFTLDLNGLNAVNFTNDPGVDGDAAWSPDGESIAFTSARFEYPAHSVYRARADGQGIVRLTNPDDPDWDVTVTWVP